MEPDIQGGDDAAMSALGREVGRRSVERLGTGLTRLIEETSALFRWTLTMLVLLNGAALYACISARNALGSELFEQLIRIFFGGVMAALLAALVGMILTFPVAGAIRRAITHWTDVSLSGALSDEALSAARRVRRSGVIWLAATTIIALTSLALFALGALMLGERFGIVAPPGGDRPAVEISHSSPQISVGENGTQALAEPANALRPDASPTAASQEAQAAPPPAPAAAASRAAPVVRKMAERSPPSRPVTPKANPVRAESASSPRLAPAPSPQTSSAQAPAATPAMPVPPLPIITTLPMPVLAAPE